MKNKFLYFIIFILLFGLTSCQTNKNNNSSADNPSSTTDSNYNNEEYDYRIIDGKIELTKFKGTYRSLIKIPENIDNKDVFSIATGCFKKNDVPSNYKTKQFKNHDDNNEESDYSTYIIGENIENIDEDAFEENSTFTTPKKGKPNGWKDDAITGSAKDGEGNTYYNTKDEDVIIKEGIVYVLNDILNTFFVARCLTNRKEVEIPSLVNGIAVTDIGRDSFSFNNKIEKVTFPETIGWIYPNAFNSCVSLSEVVFTSKTLSKILSQAFYNCTALNKVVLPENCAHIASFAFAKCGTISELYIPFTMTLIAEMAFSETIIEKIFYNGTQEQWEQINIAEDVRVLFSNATIEYKENQNKIEIFNLNKILDVSDNTLVTITGVITGFYSTKGVMITDSTDNFTIYCYNDDGLPFTDLEMIGSTVKATGTKMFYTGQLELNNCQLELLDLPKVKIEPLEVDWSNPNINVEEYINKYVVIRGIISRTKSSNAWIEGVECIQLYRKTSWGFPTINTGDNVEIKGWVLRFNQIFEIAYDNRLVEFI